MKPSRGRIWRRIYAGFRREKPYQQISLTLHDKQAELILACIDYVHTHGEVKETFGNENHKGNGVYEVVRQWAEQKKLV